jgi:outer membrane lipopolysaccharide assembly protein LptE/RlpB
VTGAMQRRRPDLLLALFPILLLGGCGYHVSGTTDVLPKNVKTIAIPAFANITTRYKLSDLMSAALTREFISRTRYRVVADPAEADAVLSGSVINFIAYPTIFDPATSRAAGVQAIVMLQVTLRDRASSKVLFSRPHMEIRQNYEISVDAKTYFDESSAAMERLSRDLARTIVSAVLENF